MINTFLFKIILFKSSICTLKSNKISIILVVLFFAQFTHNFLNAQKPYDLRNDTTKTVSFETIVPRLENLHQVRFYYKPEWFLGKMFRESIIHLSLNSAIEVLSRMANLTTKQITPIDYVFVPIELLDYSAKVNNKGVLLIGEQNGNDSNSSITISGRIIDFKNGKPLDGARLTIDNLNLNSISDKNGRYKIVIPSGEFDIRLNYVGYEENFRRIRVFGSGIVDFELSETTIRLKDLEVTDRAGNLNVLRTQMSSIRMNPKMIKELPSFLGVKDVVKSMTLLPGVQSTGEFGTGFFVRGGSADQNLILIEDIPIFNSAHAFGLVSSVNSDAVSSVTLLKAGIPSKFGERASSVLDIKFENNADKLSGKGGLGLLDSRLNFELPLFQKKVSLFVGGRSSYSNWLLHAMPEVELKNSSASFFDLNALVKVKISERDNVSLFGYYSKDNFSFTQNSPYIYDNSIASVRYSHVFNNKFFSTLVAGISRYRNSITSSDTLKLKEAYKINASVNYKTIKLNFNWTPFDSHAIEFGTNTAFYNIQQGQLQPYGSQSEITPLITSAQNGAELSAFISDNIKISPIFSAEIGIRYTQFLKLGVGKSYIYGLNLPKTESNIVDTINYVKNEIMKQYAGIEPRVSLRYSLNENSSLKMSFNTINQHINLISNTAVMSPTDVYNLSGNNVKPLINNQFALGYFINSNSNSYETSVEVYYKKSSNIVEYRNGANILMNNTLEAELLNAKGYSYGLELYFKKNTGKLTGWLSYTYSRAFRKTTSVFLEDQISKNNYYSSPFDIPTNIVLNANYHLTRRWRASAIFQYNTGKPVTLPELKFDYNGKQSIYYSDRNKYRLPDYHRLDIAITYDESLRFKQKWKGSWTLSILNLYGQKNPYSVFYKSVSQIESKFSQKFNLFQMSIIERPLPTITYNFSF